MPPIAFVIYVAFAGALYLSGRALARTPRRQSHLYASGERHSSNIQAAPGYSTFFVSALFFAVLHLGVLVVASGVPSPLTAVYIVGLILALIALILG